MSSYYAMGIYGLGGSNAEDAQGATVGKGPAFPWIDAAIDVRGISSQQAPGVPTAIRSALEAGGAKVDRAAWGGGDNAGGSSTRGKVYVRWQPEKGYGAVPYADVAQRIVASAGESFPGALLILHRYRIDRPWPSDDVLVYPEGADVPAGAPANALAVSPATLDAVQGKTDPDPEVDEQVASSGLGTTAKIAVAVGATAAGVGLLAWAWARFGRK